MQNTDRDEALMSDYQFKYIMDLKDENTVMKKEIEALRAEKNADDVSGMTDYQFKAFMALLRETLEKAFELGKSQEEILTILIASTKDTETISTD